MIFLLVLIAVLTLADIFTTYKILSNGGKELNPVVRYLIEKFGLKVGLLSRLPFQIIITYFLYTLGIKALIIYSVLYTFVIIWNTYQIIK